MGGVRRAAGGSDCDAGRQIEIGTTQAGHRSGLVAIVGRPNVGKSTLLNRVLGQKVSIVTPKPQTTRRRILGVKTVPGAQVLFLDTPGLHRARDPMNRRMVQHARQALEEADVGLWVVDAAARKGSGGFELGVTMAASGKRVVVALNKMDRVRRERLLPLMHELSQVVPDAPIVPVSARSGENVQELLRVVVQALPEGPCYYPGDALTGETERELAAEVVREKIMLATAQEVPYEVAVTVDAFDERDGGRLAVINATIHVSRASQKPILLGAGGGRLKSIGTAARLEIERMLDRRVYLELFVRVQPGWNRDRARLEEFGV